jgi:membrane-bound lytic murein transglycosylase F
VVGAAAVLWRGLSWSPLEQMPIAPAESVPAGLETPLEAVRRKAGLAERRLSELERAFLDHVVERLPRYRGAFVEAERNWDIDWRLLAAIGYQESKWDPLAISPTGVRGLMMLTEATARAMGVHNRLDPLASIAGGARYFSTLQEMMPERIREPDRTWFALAAYNQGPGHLEDARVLAQRLAMNADRWESVRQALKLKADPEFFEMTRLGYARGHEAVQFAERVWQYYGLLCRIEPALMDVTPRQVAALR